MGKMAQLLRALAVLPEYLSSVPESTSGVRDIYNSSSLSVTMPLAATALYTHVHILTCRHTSMHNLK